MSKLVSELLRRNQPVMLDNGDVITPMEESAIPGKLRVLLEKVILTPGGKEVVLVGAKPQVGLIFDWDCLASGSFVAIEEVPIRERK